MRKETTSLSFVYRTDNLEADEDEGHIVDTVGPESRSPARTSLLSRIVKRVPVGTTFRALWRTAQSLLNALRNSRANPGDKLPNNPVKLHICSNI